MRVSAAVALILCYHSLYTVTPSISDCMRPVLRAPAFPTSLSATLAGLEVQKSVLGWWWWCSADQLVHSGLSVREDAIISSHNDCSSDNTFHHSKHDIHS